MSMLLAITLAASAAPAPPLASLENLAGEWRAQGAGARVIHVDYRTISNGSAMVERWSTASGRETMTVYFSDRGAVLATHYCGQGNQATLRFDGPARSGQVDFRFVSATGVDPGEGVLVGLTLIATPNRLTRVETYRKDGKDAVERLEFERIPTAASAEASPAQH